MKLRHAAPGKCPQRLERGEVKRFALHGKLWAYTIGCPGCGFCAPYLADDAGYVEGPLVETRAEHREREVVFRAPETLSTTHPLPCYGCGGRITIEANEIATAPR